MLPVDRIQRRINDLAERRSRLWRGTYDHARAVSITRELNGHARDIHYLAVEPFRFFHSDGLYAQKRAAICAAQAGPVDDELPYEIFQNATTMNTGWVGEIDLKYERCNDCDVRGAIHDDGHVRRDPVYDVRLCAGCEGCNSKGRCRSPYPPVDFYNTGR